MRTNPPAHNNIHSHTRTHQLDEDEVKLDPLDEDEENVISMQNHTRALGLRGRGWVRVRVRVRVRVMVRVGVRGVTAVG